MVEVLIWIQENSRRCRWTTTQLMAQASTVVRKVACVDHTFLASRGTARHVAMLTSR
jgi:hypothetical protein